MYKNKKILAIIPARGGSKRIPNKNIKLLNKKPLIYYAIKTALNCKMIDKVIVSTDNKKIANVAKRYKAEIPFLRPAKLAQDKTSDQPVIRHCIEFLEQKGEKYDYILYLKPTTPLRTARDVEEAIKTIHKKNLPLVRSVTEMSGVHHPYWMYRNKNKTLSSFVKGLDFSKFYQSQLLPKNIVALNGVVEVFTRDHAMQAKFIYSSKKIGGILIPPERAMDIDEPIDFKIIELIMKK